MPPPSKSRPAKSIRDIADEAEVYPIEAFDFVQRGVPFTVTQLHGTDAAASPDQCRHVSGPELCNGLRQLALRQWGMLAGVVLRRWNVTSTLDFGRIVFHLVDGGYLKTTEEDSVDDFRNVFDFRSAFDEGYRIDLPLHLTDNCKSGKSK